MNIEKKPMNKKIVTVALAGILAMGAFSAAPAFAGKGGNSCSASGCNKKSEKSSCSSKNSCKGKHSCKGANSCKDKNSCKDANSCKGKEAKKAKSNCKSKSGCKSKGKAPDHRSNSRYND